MPACFRSIQLSRRDFLKKCAAVGAGGFVLSNRAMEVRVASKRPNIILIMAGDQLHRFARDRRWKLYDQSNAARAGKLFDVKADRLEQNPIEPGQGGNEAAQARTRLQAVLDSMNIEVVFSGEQIDGKQAKLHASRFPEGMRSTRSRRACDD